MDGWMNGRTDR